MTGHSVRTLAVLGFGSIFVACSGGGSSGGGAAPATTTAAPATSGGGATTASSSSQTTPAPTPAAAPSPDPTPVAGGTPRNFKVAFIGDQGTGSDAIAVLNLIKSEGAACVVHQGDFDYSSDPQAWDDQIDSVLGSSFPYFASPGNHDSSAWDGANGYRAKLEARMNRIGLKWTGTLGEESTHHFGGVFFVLVGPDVTGPGDGNYDMFIKSSLAADDSLWSVTSWHKNMNAMQCGGKGDESGWGVYEESRRGGAIAATGHEHSYSRTHLMSNMENQVVASTANTLVLEKDDPNTAADEGRSFTFVSGLGGRSPRNQDRGGAWWAKIYTSDQGAESGALFGEFNYNGNPRMARFYFKNISNVVVEEFFVQSNL